MADSFTPTIAPQTDGSGNPPEQVQQQPDATEPVPITEQEVGEYREQDRYLPVSPPSNTRFSSTFSQTVTRDHSFDPPKSSSFPSHRVLAVPATAAAKQHKTKRTDGRKRLRMFRVS